MRSDTMWGFLVWLVDWLMLGVAVLALLGWVGIVWWAGGRPWGSLDPSPGGKEERDDE